MATYYLKNTSGTTVTLRDLAIVLEDNNSLPIDSNDITGWLTPDMADALNTPSDLILGTTDIGDSSGDFTPDEAIRALSLVSRYDRDNPNSVTFTQTVTSDPNTDITAAETEELTDGSDTSLHIHDNRYYTESELSQPNAGVVQIHWDNIISTPEVGAPEWQEPVFAIAEQVSGAPPAADAGDFYMDTDDSHLYKYDGTSWIDQGAPNIGDRFVDDASDLIYEWDGSSWTSEAPEQNWSILVQDDGDEKGAQYVYDGVRWTKIADVDWGTHSSIGGRDVADSHPAYAISYSNTLSGLTATDVQAALDEIALEGGVDISNLLVVAKNGDDFKVGVTLGTFANPFATIQAAIDSVPTSGLNAATADNPFLVMVMPGEYEENVNTSKEYAYIAGWDKESTIITSATGNTVIIATTGDKSSGLQNITIESTSVDGSDNALLLTGNDPQLHNVDLIAEGGARAAYVNGSYNYTFDKVDLVGHFRIDNGTTDFLLSSVSGGQTTITNGSLLIREGKFQFGNGDVIQQSGGSVRFIGGKIESAGIFKDYNQTSGSVAWGWIDCDESKLVFNGTYELIFKAIRLAYNNASSGLSAVNVQDAIDEIDGSLDSVYNDFNTHVGDVANPHEVTFTQVVAQDAGTDITVIEAETLTDGSNADDLHYHDADNIVYNKSLVDELDVTDVQSAIDYIAEYYRVDPKNVIFVAKNGADTDLYNGHRGSAGAPYATIQAAVNRVEFNNDNSMDNPYLIWIAPGLYEENVILNDNRLDNLSFASNNAIVRPASGDAFRSSLLNGGLSKLEFDNIVIDGNLYFEGAVDGGNTFESILKIQNSEITGSITGKNLISLELEDVYFDGSLSVENVSDVIYRNVRHESNNAVSLTYNSSNAKPINSVQTHMLIQDSNVKADIAVGVGAIVESMNSTVGSSSSTTTVNGTMITYAGWLGANSTVVNATGELTTRGTFFDKPSLTVQPSGVWNNETKSDVVFYDNTITQIPADNVQDAIGVLKTQIDAFKIPKGTEFPVPAEDADLFYRTDLSITYQFDGSRDKWLSTTQMTYDWGANNADGKYLNIHGAAATMSGYLMPRSGTIIALTAKIASGNQSKNIEIRSNHNNTPLKTLALVSGSYSSAVENIDFLAGDYLQAFVTSTGTPARDIVVVAIIAWGE